LAHSVRPILWVKAVAGLFEDFHASNPLPSFVWGSLAFLVYETATRHLLDRLGAARSPVLSALELLVFGLTATCLFLYSRIRAISQKGAGGAEKQSLEHRKRVVRIRTELCEKIAAFSQGIEHSLSAIMFFVRAQLTAASEPHVERDLREVMERIDQIQLLLKQMKQSIGGVDVLSKTRSVPASLIAELANAGSVEARSAAEANVRAGAAEATKDLSLRRCARKVMILPITVNYVRNDTELEFHTYTVNICEDGACVVFPEQDLDEETRVRVAMPQDLQAHAYIRWIQPLRENSFRLAGIEFIDSRVEMKSFENVSEAVIWRTQ
jgi:hypothetical protein